MVMVVPEAKLQRFKEEAQRVLGKERITPRELARLAGQLLSFTPAVDLAPLLARGLFHALAEQKVEDWDLGFESHKDLVDTLQWCSSAVEQYNGTRMIRRGASSQLVLVGDASEVGTGLFTPNGELLAAGLPPEIVTSWNAGQLASLASQQFSSSLREIIALREGLSSLAERAPDLLLHGAVQYRTDSQVAAAAVNRMGGNPSLFKEVKELWTLCKQLDCELSVLWQPREDDMQVYADLLSKLTDNSAWELNAKVYKLIMKRLPRFNTPKGRKRRAITVDLFADGSNNKHERFFCRWFCPGTAGINSFEQRWDWYWCKTQNKWRRHMGFYNGPFDCMGRILRKILDERADVVLVYPRWPRH